MKRKSNKNKPICPCCKGKLTLNDCSILEKSYQDLFKESSLEKVWAKIPHTGTCDDCIQRKRAILARPKVQNYNPEWDLPFFMFWDKTTTCEDCKVDFVFSKEEQQFWYEKLKFYRYSFPKHCPTCRKKRREKIAINNRLMELLNQEYLKDAKIMEEISEIYAQIGNEQKSELFAKRVEKLNTTHNKVYK